jgi:hypothetical protein
MIMMIIIIIIIHLTAKGLLPGGNGYNAIPRPYYSQNYSNPTLYKQSVI